VLVFCVRAFFSLLAMASAAASSAIFDNCFMKKNCHSSRALLLTQFVENQSAEKSRAQHPSSRGSSLQSMLNFQLWILPLEAPLV
jgi:hypothetical protein